MHPKETSVERLALEEVVERYELAWKAGVPRLEDYLTDDPAQHHLLLIELVHTDLEYRLKAGQPARVEEYLQRFPDLGSTPDAFVELIEAEYSHCRNLGYNLSVEEYLRRFPEFSAQLAKRLNRPSEKTTLVSGDQAAPNLDLLPGRLGRYRIEGEIARGGMGRVIRVHDEDIGRPLAMKVLLNPGQNQPDLDERFLREARLTGQLQHPGVPPVQELGRLPDGQPYFIMKLVAGHSLNFLLSERTSPGQDLMHFLNIFEQICQTLAYAHRQGIIHRDLKPANVMVGAFGEVQVMDWGLAKVLTSASEPDAPARDFASALGGASGSQSDTQHKQPAAVDRAGETPQGGTEAGQVLGTPAYMAPEQARGEIDQLDARCDVFGLGAILCEVLTGSPPYRGRAVNEVHDRAKRADLTEARSRLESCEADAELVALARACLVADKEARPADGAAVAAAAAAYRQEVQRRLKAAEIAAATATARAAEEKKRRRVQLVLAATVLLIVLGGGAAFWLFQEQQQQRAGERASQQQRVDAAVDKAMGKTRLLLQQAKTGAVLDLGQFQLALAEAQKAEQLAHTGRASDQVSQQAADLIARIRGETEDAQRDHRLLVALAEVRSPREGPKYQVNERGLMIQVAEPSADEQFVSAFRVWGLEVDTTPTATAVARLRERPAAVLLEVIAALDEWVSERRLKGLPAARWLPLKELAQALDGSDSKGRELRALLAGNTLDQERALGQLALALRPVPIPFDMKWGKNRNRLRQWAAQTDTAREPVLGLLNLARALRVAGEEEQVERLLRRALLYRPREVVLWNTLGQWLENQAPPRWGQALECYVAARVLRPDLGESLANAFMEVGRATEGLALYEHLLANNPNNPWLHFRQGNAWYDRGRYQEAAAAYRKSLALDPNDAHIYYNLGLALTHQNDLPLVIAQFRKALQLNPNLAQAHNGIGVALLAQKDLKDLPEAIAQFRKTITLHFNDARVYHNLGTALYELKDFPGAIVQFRKAIALDPNFALAYNGLGNVLLAQKDLPGALDQYRKAIALDPNLVRVYYNIGLALHAQKNLPGAIAQYRKAIALNPNYPLANNNLGNALYELKDFPGAIAQYHRAIALDPNLALAHYNLGRALYAQKDLPGAIVQYQKAIVLDPNYPLAYNNLGTALYDQKEFTGAIAQYRKAIALNPNFAHAYNNLGKALYDQKEFPEAIAQHRKAIALDPNFADAYHNLGLALRDREDLLGAIAQFRKTIALDPNYSAAYGNLVLVFLKLGQFNEALKETRQFVELLPPGHPWQTRAQKLQQLCERLLAIERQLGVYLDKNELPEQPQELLALIQICRTFKQYHATAARLYATAFVAQPPLAEHPEQNHRYQAACSALLAAAGQGRDPFKLTAQEKTKLRAQALAWLQADLQRWAKQFQDRDLKALPGLCIRLPGWQQDPALVVVREAKERAKLPADEQPAWEQLWTDVDQLLKQVAANVRTVPFRGILTAKERERVQEVKLQSGQVYLIDLESTRFDAYLRLHDSQGKLLAENDDIEPGVNPNARLLFTAPADGTYRLVATSFEQRGTGAYTLTVRSFVEAKK